MGYLQGVSKHLCPGKMVSHRFWNHLCAWHGFFWSSWPTAQSKATKKESDLEPKWAQNWDQNRTQNWGQNRDQNWNPNWAQNWDQKGGQNWKTHFGLILGPFFGTNFGSSFGTKFRQIQMEFRVSIQHWKSQETRVSVKEMTKPTKPNWKIIQGQHQPSF